MRLTYFDDAGLFNRQQEPFIVIGGCIVDADNQLIALENEFHRLVEKWIPEEDRGDFIFHAMELWNGGRYFQREKCPLEKRLEILSDLSEIPEILDIPLTFGFQERAAAEYAHPDVDWTDREKELSLYSDSYARFAESVEHVLRECWPDEVTLIIGEDNDAIRSLTKFAHNNFRDPQWVKRVGPNLTYFPFNSIREGVHFSSKTESRSLQLADFVTFFVKKKLMKDEKADVFFEKISPYLLVHPNE